MDTRNRIGLYGSYFAGVAGIGFTLPFLPLYLGGRGTQRRTNRPDLHLRRHRRASAISAGVLVRPGWPSEALPDRCAGDTDRGDTASACGTRRRVAWSACGALCRKWGLPRGDRKPVWRRSDRVGPIGWSRRRAGRTSSLETAGDHRRRGLWQRVDRGAAPHRCCTGLPRCNSSACCWRD